MFEWSNVYSVETGEWEIPIDPRRNYHRVRGKNLKMQTHFAEFLEQHGFIAVALEQKKARFK